MGYALLGKHGDDPVIGAMMDDKVEAQLDALVDKLANDNKRGSFVRAVHSLAEEYPDVGLGDTATDECIVAAVERRMPYASSDWLGELYSALHFGCLFNTNDEPDGLEKELKRLDFV